nr:hypothetical protein [Streptomyces sp. NBC_01591]
MAARCGFPRASDFTRAFRTVYGIPPKEYRHQAQSFVDSEPSATHCKDFGSQVTYRVTASTQGPAFCSSDRTEAPGEGQEHQTGPEGQGRCFRLSHKHGCDTGAGPLNRDHVCATSREFP